MNNNGFTSFNENTFFQFEKSGDYPVVLVVKNLWGCSDTVIKVVNVIEDQSLFVLNSFTQNGDGINEIFQANRWGQKIYESIEFSGGWDGSFQGKECQQDAYVWKITVAYPQGKVKQYTGHVTLNR
ncbi:MAG: gliding motility-associated C-terminal domain-containing protein [Bacteroidetes bacterium]|nr:gliding motility-associated C-terminal domain-containing protein [Bacteroidota bacterium]